MLIVIFGPIILLVIGSTIVGVSFGRSWAGAFALTTICLLAINLFWGFQAQQAYLAQRAWTASSLAVLNYWLDGFVIVPGSFAVWMAGLGGVRLFQCIRKRAK
jgi:hypothetical protein